MCRWIYKGVSCRSISRWAGDIGSHMADQIQTAAEFLPLLDGANAISAVPLPLRRPPVDSPFRPYIYTRAEIRRLLSMIRIGQKNSNCKIDIPTLRMLILFLYGTGALLSDALTFRRDDLDLRKRTITFRSSRPYRSRTIPICSDLYNVLRRYHATNHRTILREPRTCSSTRTGRLSPNTLWRRHFGASENWPALRAAMA